MPQINFYINDKEYIKFLQCPDRQRVAFRAACQKLFKEYEWTEESE